VRKFFVGSLTAGSVVLAVFSLALVPSAAQIDGAAGGTVKGKGKTRPKGGPIERMPDGKPSFMMGQGVWGVPYITNMAKKKGGADQDVEVPFLPAAKKIYDERVDNNAKDDPEGYCLPPGVPRMMYTPYPMEMLQFPNRIVFIYEGGAHVWRDVPVAEKGKLQHPKDPNPTYLGDSIAWWEGDTLVIDVVGFNDRTWLDFSGHPHGEKLHVVERYTMLDTLNMKYEVLIEDPEFYSKPWSMSYTVARRADDKLLEYICQENNRDIEHLVGK
jgi:hypothetical protein